MTDRGAWSMPHPRRLTVGGSMAGALHQSVAAVGQDAIYFGVMGPSEIRRPLTFAASRVGVWAARRAFRFSPTRYANQCSMTSNVRVTRPNIQEPFISGPCRVEIQRHFGFQHMARLPGFRIRKRLRARV